MLLMGDILPERLTLAGMCMGRCEAAFFFLVDDGPSGAGATAVGVMAISGSFLLPATPTSPICHVSFPTARNYSQLLPRCTTT